MRFVATQKLITETKNSLMEILNNLSIEMIDAAQVAYNTASDFVGSFIDFLNFQYSNIVVEDTVM